MGVAQPRSGAFYKILTEAVADITNNGFDGQKRLDFWLGKLTMAAQGVLVPQAVLEDELKQALSRVYHRAVTNGKLLKVHKGIGRFTLDAVKPKLRSQLDQRIAASANLIKLNRKASIERTLSRFSGWATSIPAGGSTLVNKVEEAGKIRRAIAGLPFEERRVVIDQGHKLNAAVSDIIAVDGGAIAGRWVHVMERSHAYTPRPDHVERNGVIYVIRGNSALDMGLMKLDGHKYTDQITAPGEEVYCRCSYEYLYNLRDLPKAMLTQKGTDELARVRAEIAGWK